MVVTAAVRHHDGGGAEGDGESAGVRQTPLDSTGLRWTANQAESGGLVNWTGLHQTPPDYSLAVLSDSAMDLAGHSVWWSLVEEAEVCRSPTGLCGGEIRTQEFSHSSGIQWNGTGICRN